MLQFNLMGPINQQMIESLIQLTTKGVRSGASQIRIGMSSPGGNVFYGVTAHNFLVGLPVPVLTHNLGQVDSVTAVLYCAGSQRTCVPHARFLIHGISTMFAANTQLEEKQVRERLAGMESDRRNIAAILARTTGKDPAVVQDDMLNGLVLSAEQARDYGFVTGITEQFFDFRADINTIHTS
jgi:ATP-dependent protease ClpP protease subunit